MCGYSILCSGICFWKENVTLFIYLLVALGGVLRYPYGRAESYTGMLQLELPGVYARRNTWQSSYLRFYTGWIRGWGV